MNEDDSFVEQLASKSGLEPDAVRSVFKELGLGPSARALGRQLSSDRITDFDKGKLILGWRIGNTIIAA